MWVNCFSCDLLDPITRHNARGKIMQAANLRGFRASMNPRFEVGILDFMDGIPDFKKNFKFC